MKKFFTLCISTLVMSMTLNAQNWVSTTPENKKVILEEFTGINCNYCPDGHKRADAIIANNPNNVFVVNIHTGGYATPRDASQPDFRIAEGNAIGSVANPSGGYPAGSVNRFKNPWAENRGQWNASANTILGQASPVNVYVKSYFERSSRELTTEVEVYYTDNVSTDNKLTVMLTQDNILGYQLWGERDYPENMVGDQYKHNKVLRDVITPGGAWGETISETDKGDYTYKKYVTKLPESINNIPLIFYNLNVIAFVSGSDNSNILSGNGNKVDYDRNGAVDLALSNKTVIPQGLCVDPFTPSVEVTNSSNETITSFDMTLNINGVNKTESFNGTIAPGNKTTIDFGQTITPRGEYSVSVSGFKNINGGDLFDTDLSNDATTISGLGYQKEAFTYKKFHFDGTMDEDAGRWIKDNPQYLIRQNIGKAGSSILYYLHESWGIANKPGQIVLGEADFSSMTDPTVSFYYAYTDGDLGGSQPMIDVEVSEDCGVNFDYVKSIQCESTGSPADPSRLYSPTPGEFRQVTVDLAKYAGKKVLISVAGVPGSSGNALYIDEIEIGSAAKIASTQSVEIAGLAVYPNPANDHINVTLTDKDAGTLTLMDMQGKTIKNMTFTNGSAIMSTDNISEGIYLLNISNGTATSTVKVDIKH